MNYRCVLAAAIAGLGCSSHAAITFFDVFRTEGFQQTSDSQPITSFGFYWNSRITTNTVSEVPGGTFVDANAHSHSLVDDGSGKVVIGGSGFVADDAAISAELGSGLYTLSVQGGVHNGESATLDGTLAHAYPDQVPYLTGGSFSALQNAQSGQDVTIQWNSFDAPTSTKLVFLSVFNVTTSTFVMGNFGADGVYTGDTISGASLNAGDTYHYDLFFSSRYETANQGFGGATGDLGFDRVTGGDFTVVPEPSTWLALGGFALLLKRRKSLNPN